MRQMLGLSVLLTSLAAGMARAEDVPHDNTWGFPTAPRPVTLTAPYSDCRLTTCETPCPEHAPACAAQPAGPMIIDMTPYSPPRGYSPSADFGARVQAAPGCAIAGDAPLPTAIFPHPVSMPPQPFAVYTPICPSSCLAEAPSAGYLPQPPASFASSAAAVSPPIFTAALPPSLPHPMAYAPGTPALYSHPTSMPPSAAFVQYGPYACVQPACACPSCCGPACECPNAGATGYHPQVIYPASQCCNQASAESCGDCADRLDHVLEAVRHLEAAGLQADADRLRHQCDAEMRGVVERLKRAEAELAQLRAATREIPAAHCEQTYCKTSAATKPAAQKQVLVHVQLMELNRTKCRNLGFDFATIKGDSFVGANIAGVRPKDGFNFGTVDGKSAFFTFLGALRKEGVLTVLSDPSVCTVSGRPAAFSCGCEIPFPTANVGGNTPVDYHLVGTKIDCVPVVRDDGKVRLEIRARWSQLDPTRSMTIANQTVPGLKVREFDTGAEMSAGQALVMCGPVEKRVVNAQRDHVPPIFNRLENMVGESAVLEAMKEPFCHSTGVAEEEEIEFLAVVRPEIVEPEECAAPSEPNGKSAGVADWIKSAMTECKSNCGQPASCDEGPMCKCAGSCCAAQKECAEAGCLTEAKSIFALPGLQQPFTSQTIYVDPAAFTTPIDIPQRFMFDRNVEYEFQLPSSSGQFLPASIAPVRFTQPVVLPVDASTLK